MLTLTLLMGVYRTNVPFEVLSATETFSAIFHFAYINSATFLHTFLRWRLLLRTFPFACNFRRHPTATAFLRQIRNWHRRRGACTGSATFRLRGGRICLKKSILTGCRSVLWVRKRSGVVFDRIRLDVFIFCFIGLHFIQSAFG